MSKLFATLENSRGKTVSLSDNERIEATVYDKNMKAYSVTIEWANVGDPERSESEGGTPCFAAIVTTREWRNRERTNDRPEGWSDCNHYATDEKGLCHRCGYNTLRQTNKQLRAIKGT